VESYTNLIRAHLSGGTQLQKYQLGSNPPAGVERLTSLKMSFDVRAILDDGLIGTVTGCVKQNTPTSDGRYRNGALLVQAVASPATSSNINGSGNGNTDPIYTLETSPDSMLWESTIFWHWDGPCTNAAGWQAFHDACFFTGSEDEDVCSCLKDPLEVSFCQDVPDPVPDPDPDPVPVPSTPVSDTCTNAAANPNPIDLKLEFSQDLCAVVVTPEFASFDIEFDKDLVDQTTTLTIGSDSISFLTFTPTTKTTVGDYEFDLLTMQTENGKKSQFKGIKVRNATGSVINMDEIIVSWTGGDSSQKVKKVRETVINIDEYDMTDDPGPSFTVDFSDYGFADVTLPVIGGTPPPCTYTLEVDYTEVATPFTPRSTTIDFDPPDLTGSTGSPLEIDMDEANLSADETMIDTILLGTNGLRAYTIDKITVSWTDPNPAQRITKVIDETNGTTPFDGSGNSGTEVITNIDVGGLSTGEDCPVADSPGYTGTADGSGTGAGTGTGSGTGTGAGTGTGSGSGTSTGANVSNTTSEGGTKTGRLLWREIMR
jgi:hypothetical protein